MQIKVTREEMVAAIAQWLEQNVLAGGYAIESVTIHDRSATVECSSYADHELSIDLDLGEPEEDDDDAS